MAIMEGHRIFIIVFAFVVFACVCASVCFVFIFIAIVVRRLLWSIYVFSFLVSYVLCRILAFVLSQIHKYMFLDGDVGVSLGLTAEWARGKEEEAETRKELWMLAVFSLSSAPRDVTNKTIETKLKIAISMAK